MIKFVSSAFVPGECVSRLLVPLIGHTQVYMQSEDLLSSQHANGILRFRLDRMRDNRDDLQNEVATLKEDLQYKRRQYSIVTRAYYKKVTAPLVLPALSISFASVHDHMSLLLSSMHIHVPGSGAHHLESRLVV